MLQLLIILQGLLPDPNPTHIVHTYSLINIIIFSMLPLSMLILGVAAIADFITALRKKSKQNTPTA
ncbi:MAG: hypothetical protein LBG17_02785 [Bacteroidales bacterium]|jgi:hypothetical protein|nr:hypothetical protein [Bacteroidales bacterium]